MNCFVRSHQCVQFGYEIIMGNDHGCQRSIYTVFSSANYRGAGNDGAVLLLTTDGVTTDSPSAQSLHERGTCTCWWSVGEARLDVVVGWDTRIAFSDPMLDSLLSGLVRIA